MGKPTQQSRSKAKAVPTKSAARQPITVSVRWLISAIVIAIAAAMICTWGALCLIFWQGSWQLLYHPTAPITRTPASAGITFDNVEFGPSQASIPQLTGWWVPGDPGSGFTALFLHGATGNLSETVDALASFHQMNLSVLAFDYRGYGQSKFVRPSETHWSEDAESAIRYLRDTRHIPAQSLIVIGIGLGANLALQAAASHSDLAGVILIDPVEAPTDAIFRDPRAGMVPARALVRDRWDTRLAEAGLRIPSLWLFRGSEQKEKLKTAEGVSSRKTVVWLTDPNTAQKVTESAISRWLYELSSSVAPRQRGISR